MSSTAVVADTKMFVLLRDTALSSIGSTVAISKPPSSPAACSVEAVSSAAASAMDCTAFAESAEPPEVICAKLMVGYSPSSIWIAVERSSPSPISKPSNKPSIAPVIALVRKS